MEVPRPTLEILERTRRGESVDPADVVALVNAWRMGAASDAQMSAWCATAGIRGVSQVVASAVATAILAGGDRLELASLGPTADLRSTGGVGDSALVFAASATAAALGVIVASTGTRGLAGVGGILDALDAIPGMQAERSLEQYVLQARDVGIVIAEAGTTLVPAERALADLRESTATADGDLLVAVAAAVRGVSGGAGSLVVEVPGGSGALLVDTDHATAAGELIAALGAQWHRRVAVHPSIRPEPLGGVSGHSLEIGAAAAVLRGEGDAALVARVAEMAGTAAELSGIMQSGGAAAAAAAIADGRALELAERWIEAQGGEPGVLTAPDGLMQASINREVVAPATGELTGVDAGTIGLATRWLGAGRLDPGQVIDPAVGVEMLVRVGDTVTTGQPVAMIHASDDWLAGRAEEMLANAWVITGP